MSTLGKRLNIGGVDFYLAEPVDRLLTEALGLAKQLQELASGRTSAAFIKHDPYWQAAQRFIEEHGGTNAKG